MVSEVPVKAYAMKALDSQAGSTEVVAAARGEAPQLAIFSISSKSSVSNLSIFLSEGKKDRKTTMNSRGNATEVTEDSKAVWGGTPCGTVMLPSRHKAGCLSLSSRHQGH